ncbi:ATP-binding protein [Parvibaculum sp.]|uniref:ATP-binding protein n=1 Tax=Parvibaculum sp. TaxID=2024848 RepID=UPI002CCA1355|nr:ATP-binding protein [Parvibaculum sp.]HUD51881.1 ATP-binding protein [Parvibaculum sp.]
MAKKESEHETIWGGPTKRFFVSMLTRDIGLSDAILDLIDNCVDGATRQLKGRLRSEERPYDGYEARLTLSAKSFDITDNCGGIPREAIADAFLLGRPKVEKDKDLPTIGMYGIGMKRAIFKIGQEAIVESYASDGAFSVEYDRAWLEPENQEWDLSIAPLKNKKEKGVTICVPTLKKEISRQFGNAAFQNELRNKVSEHFGYLMQKGFSIWVNGEKVRPKTLQLYTSDSPKDKGIRPYDFEATNNGVHIRVTVGFYRTLVRMEEVDEAAERTQEKEQAGISVICNERLVLENDKSLITGWGDGSVPKYHPQFRGIAGFIIFSTDEPEKLPISTTKRDLDVGADVYLFARKYCMEGLRECTDFTNKWKGMEDEATQHFDLATKRDARTEVNFAAKHGVPIRGNEKAKKFSAKLPVPEQRNPMRRISFTRKEDAVRSVSEHLFGESGQKPSVVGQECFDRALKASRK